MRGLLLLCLVGAVEAQTCTHQVTRSPIGPALVFRNGKLLRQGREYTYATAPGTMPIITPLAFAAGDAFSVVFSRQLPLSLTVAGSTVQYSTYQNWQEIWDCTSSSAPQLNLLEQCSGSGNTSPANIPAWDPSVAYSLGALAVYNGLVYSSLQCSNTGQQPDISSAFWAAQTWNCAGLFRATITKADGTKLTIVGVNDSGAGQGVWSPVQ